MQFKELDLKTLDLEPINNEEIIEEFNQSFHESIANCIKKISLQELADILEASTRTITTNHAGMLTNTFVHPTIGTATTIQSSGNGALLIKHLSLS